MFGFSFDRIRRSGRLSAALAMAISSLALLALCAPTEASAAFGDSRKPVAASQDIAPATPGPNAEVHGMGALIPTMQVNAIAPGKDSSANQTVLPASVDLSSYAVPVGNQGQLGSCVTWAINYGMLGWYSNRYNKPGQPFNPMYTYSQIHAPEPGGGSFPKDALNIALTQGNDTMAHYSHPTNDYTSLPNASERANAANFKISGWQYLFANTSGFGSGTTSTEMIKSALASGKPVAISLNVRPGFAYIGKASTSLDNDTTGTISGRHEVLATGYDQSGLWIQNSWGTSWGYNGYGHLSWAVVGKDVYEAETISGFAVSSTDTTAPAMGAVNQQLKLGAQVTGTTAPVQFSWSATDAVGVTAYEVLVKTDAGGFVKDTTVASNATSVAYSLLLGHTYQLAVRAKDAAGNWSATSYSVTVTPGVTDDKAFSTTATWGRYTMTDSFGGTYMAASVAGASFTYNVTGRDIALIAPKFSNGGRATLYCDGTSYGMINQYSATTLGRQVVAWCHFSQSGQHTMKVVLEGTSGRPWFAVDAFAYVS